MQIDTELFKKNVKQLVSDLNSQTISNAMDIENIVLSLNQNLLKQINAHAPYIKKKVKITNQIVTNKEILEARRIKRRAENKFRKTRLEADKYNLKIARKKLVKIVQNSRNKFFQDKFSKHKNNIKQTYKIINQLLDKNNDKIFPAHTDEKNLAERFAHFYSEKVELIRNSLSNNTSTIFKDNINIKTRMNKFNPVSEDEILNIITKLADKQSVLDPLPCSLFKLCKLELLPLIHKLINSSLELGYFPNCLKINVITPIIKSKRLDSNILNHFRPVSELTLISKIYEKCALQQLMEHLCNNDLFCKFQSAYRSDHSCETALMKIYDDVIKHLTPTTYVVMVFSGF